MLSAFRIFYDRRFFAAVIYIAMAVVLFIMVEPRPRFLLTDDERRSTISFTPDGKWFITALNQTTTKDDETTTSTLIRMRDLGSDNTVRELGAINGDYPRISVSPDSPYMVASTHREAIVWQFANGEKIRRKSMPGEVDRVVLGTNPIALCRVDKPVANMLFVVPLIDEGPIRVIGPADRNERSVMVNPNGTLAATWDHGETETPIRVWQLSNATLVSKHRIPITKWGGFLLGFGPNDDSIIWFQNGDYAPNGTDESQIHQSYFANPNGKVTLTMPSNIGWGNRRWPWSLYGPTVNCAFTPDRKLFIIGSQYNSAIILYDEFQLKESPHDAQSSPDVAYLSSRVDKKNVLGEYDIRIQELPSLNATFLRTFSLGDGDSAQIIGWTPDSRFVILNVVDHGGKFRWLKTFLQELKINFDIGNNTINEIKLINPRSGKVESSIMCEDPKSLKFAPDAQCCILDGYVYDVPFRKPWWAILGLPAVLALVVWRPYGKKTRSAARRG